MSTKTKTSEPGVLARLVLFIRQIVSELKKVVRPTLSELFTYASVVLVFVLIVIAAGRRVPSERGTRGTNY